MNIFTGTGDEWRGDAVVFRLSEILGGGWLDETLSEVKAGQRRNGEGWEEALQGSVIALFLWESDNIISWDVSQKKKKIFHIM